MWVGVGVAGVGGTPGEGRGGGLRVGGRGGVDGGVGGEMVEDWGLGEAEFGVGGWGVVEGGVVGDFDGGGHVCGRSEWWGTRGGFPFRAARVDYAVGV